MIVKSITASAPVNIAVIKYWGKRDEDLILPLNDSVSVTFSTDDLRAKTSIAISPSFTEDELWLNGRKNEIENPRLQRCVKIIKDLARKKNPNNEELRWKMHICSDNNFPTAAGLASSAAGYSCLVFALSRLYNVDENLSQIARQGSGSACRSMFGGYVQWQAGTASDGSDSLARQLYPASYWPDLHCLIIVLSSNRKKIGSTEGMRRSVQTSQLLQYRAQHCVSQRIEQITEAIKNRDFPTFAKIAMQDSNQFHAVCLDSYPPINYLNDASHTLISFVEQYNEACGEIKLAYSFDAGPNPCLFVLEKDVPMALKTIIEVFPCFEPSEDTYTGSEVPVAHIQKEEIPKIKLRIPYNLVEEVIHAQVGDGPKVLPSEESLLSEAGEPLVKY